MRNGDWACKGRQTLMARERRRRVCQSFLNSSVMLSTNFLILVKPDLQHSTRAVGSAPDQSRLTHRVRPTLQDPRPGPALKSAAHLWCRPYRWRLAASWRRDAGLALTAKRPTLHAHV